MSNQSGALNQRIGNSLSWRGSRPFEVAVKLSRRTICASLWDVKRKCGRFQRTPAARTITRFHAARAAIRKLSGRILNATSRVASCRGHERALHRLSRETAPPQHVRRAVPGRRGNAFHPLWQHHSELAGCTPRQLANEFAHRPLLLARRLLNPPTRKPQPTNGRARASGEMMVGLPPNRWRFVFLHEFQTWHGTLT